MVIRRKINKVHDLHLPNGIWCNHDTILREEALNYFKSLFCPTSSILLASIGDSLMDLSLTEEAQHSLTQQVTREDVIYVLNQIHPFMESDLDEFLSIFL